MPAASERFEPVRPRERAVALAFVLIVQLALGIALWRGLRLDLARPGDVVQRLVEIGVPPPPPVVDIQQTRPRKYEHRSAAAPKAAPAPIGGSPGPTPAHAPPSVTPVIAIAPTVAPSGGGAGSGPASGAGAGGGTGGQGYGGDDGGTDLELISGELRDSDFPKSLRRAGISARVTATFTVQVNGRAAGCRVSRSSGYPEMDAAVCRVIEKRFVFRPRMDRSGRPVPEEVDWDWEAGS